LTAPAKESKGALGGAQSFIVAVRIRPPSVKELQDSRHAVLVRKIDDTMLVFDPKRGDFWSDAEIKQGGARAPAGKREKDLRYAFDHVFDSDASQVSACVCACALSVAAAVTRSTHVWMRVRLRAASQRTVLALSLCSRRLTCTITRRVWWCATC
jgi:hypothetical protein